VPLCDVICVDVSNVLASVPIGSTESALSDVAPDLFRCAPEPIACVLVLNGVPQEKKYCRDGWNRKLVRRCVSCTQADATLTN